jgi:outer membrane protein assembly factor BamB
VVTDGRVVVAIGQDPEKGDGVGSLVCIDASLTGDITRSGKLWSFDDVSRSISTVSVVDGLIYLADFAGLLHCLDEKTGQPLWTHDTEGRVWGSTLAGDGRVYVGTENGNLFILAAGRVKKIIAEIDFGSPVYSTPVAANGCLFVATDKHLYAIGGNGPK